jgi:hypothetical protein
MEKMELHGFGEAVQFTVIMEVFYSNGTMGCVP